MLPQVAILNNNSTFDIEIRLPIQKWSEVAQYIKGKVYKFKNYLDKLSPNLIQIQFESFLFYKNRAH